MSIVRLISRFVIGIVFIFSGYVKAIDPLGSAYKFSDYFEAFGMEFMMPIAFPLAVLLSSSELLIGLCLVLHLRMKVSAWALLVFMLFFTILTLILAITNPVTDCGCFGDAIILTNWQTFYKNLFFLIPTLIIFFQKNAFTSYFHKSLEWALVSGLAISAVMLSVYAYNNLPTIDFRPYKIGTHIEKDMELPEGAAVDEYETVLVYEKNGVQKEFTIEQIPSQDTAWKWVETKNVLISEGDEPPIHDFSITSIDGLDITYDILYDPGLSFLVIAYDLNKSSTEGLKNLDGFFKSLEGESVKVYGLSSSTDNVVKEKVADQGIDMEFFTSDEITLKTIIRSNPGLVLLKDGHIVGKWHYNNIPFQMKEEGVLSFALKEQAASLASNRNAIFIILTLISLGAIETFRRRNK